MFRRGRNWRQVIRQRENIIQAIKDGVPAAEVKDDLACIVERRQGLETLLAAAKEEPVLLHPNMAAQYHQQVANLAQGLLTVRKTGRSGRYLTLAHRSDRIEAEPAGESWKSTCMEISPESSPWPGNRGKPLDQNDQVSSAG